MKTVNKSIFGLILVLVFCNSALGQSITVVGTVYDKSEIMTLDGVVLKLYTNGELVDSTQLTLSKTRFLFNLNEGEYLILARKQGYEDEVINFKTKDVPNNSDIIITMGKSSTIYPLKGVALNRKTGNPVPGATVFITNAMTFEKASTIANERGEFDLSVRQGYQYLLSIERKDYITREAELDFSPKEKRSSTVFSSKGFATFGYKPDGKSFICELLMDDIKKGETIVLNKVILSSEQTQIRTEGAKQLDKIADLLEKNPNMRVELGAHTDSRGSEAYNLLLSQRQAELALNYLLGKGIDKQRIVSKGYGESQLLNRCANDVECSDQEHATNRRIEVKFL